MKNSGFFLLALWLIIQSTQKLTKLNFPYDTVVIPALALVAGGIIFLQVVKTRLGDIGLFLLSIWLILPSSLYLFKFSFPYSETSLAVLGIAAGMFLIIRK